MTSLIALMVILGLLIVLIAFVAKQSRPRIDKAYFQKHWNQIEQETNQLAAISKADSLLDEALKRLGVKGKTMGERLNNSQAFVKDINGAWSAHKLRNKLVHEHGYQSSAGEVKRALEQFKNTLKEVGAL